MTEIESKFLKQHGFLVDELINTKYKLDLLFHLHQRKEDRLDQMNIAPAFFGIVFESLQSDLIISLFRLFDSDPESITLNSLTNFVKTHLEIFTEQAFCTRDPNGSKFWHPERQITQPFIMQQRNELHLLKPILDNLRLRRNKVHAHYDKQYVFQPLKLNEEASLTYDDAHKLISFATKTVDSYSASFNNSFQYWELWNFFDIDKVLDILYESTSRKRR